MSQDPHHMTLTIARQVRTYRDARRRSGAWVAAALREEGIPWDRGVVANFETGRRAGVSVAEWLALARVLDVAPLDLLIPDDGPVQPTDAMPELSPAEARDWIIRGIRGPIVKAGGAAARVAAGGSKVVERAADRGQGR